MTRRLTAPALLAFALVLVALALGAANAHDDALNDDWSRAVEAKSLGRPGGGAGQAGSAALSTALWSAVQGYGQTKCVPNKKSGAPRNWCGAQCGYGYKMGFNATGPVVDAVDACCRAHDLDLGNTTKWWQPPAVNAHRAMVACLARLPQQTRVPTYTCQGPWWCKSWRAGKPLLARSSCGAWCRLVKDPARTALVDSDAKDLLDGFTAIITFIKINYVGAIPPAPRPASRPPAAAERAA